MNILVTGRPGVGKTTLVKAVGERLRQEPGGFYTEEVRVAGKRRGFMVKSLAGRKGTLADIDFGGPKRVGKYGVNVEEFERIALPSLKAALRASQVMVIDEIGKMELFSAPFKQLIIQCLDSPNVVVATVGKISHPFVDAILARPDVLTIEVTEEDRDHLVGKVAELVETAQAARD